MVEYFLRVVPMSNQAFAFYGYPLIDKVRRLTNVLLKPRYLDTSVSVFLVLACLCGPWHGYLLIA